MTTPTAIVLICVVAAIIGGIWLYKHTKRENEKMLERAETLCRKREAKHTKASCCKHQDQPEPAPAEPEIEKTECPTSTTESTTSD